MKPISLPLYYNGKQFYIGSQQRGSGGVHFHICYDDNTHLHGYWLFNIDFEGYRADSSIGRENRVIEKDMGLNNASQLIVIGIDEI